MNFTPPFKCSPKIYSFLQKTKKYIFKPLFYVFYLLLVLGLFLLSPIWFLSFLGISLITIMIICCFIAFLPLILLGLFFLFIGVFLYVTSNLLGVALILLISYYIAKKFFIFKE